MASRNPMDRNFDRAGLPSQPPRAEQVTAQQLRAQEIQAARLAAAGVATMGSAAAPPAPPDAVGPAGAVASLRQLPRGVVVFDVIPVRTPAQNQNVVAAPGAVVVGVLDSRPSPVRERVAGWERPPALNTLLFDLRSTHPQLDLFMALLNSVKHDSKEHFFRNLIELYRCPFCKKTSQFPYTLECGHIVCFGCQGNYLHGGGLHRRGSPWCIADCFECIILARGTAIVTNPARHQECALVRQIFLKYAHVDKELVELMRFFNPGYSPNFYQKECRLRRSWGFEPWPENCGVPAQYNWLWNKGARGPGHMA